MSFKDTMADNLANIRQWHKRNHHSTDWASCVHSPCNVTTTTFRANWDNQ